MMTMMIMMMMMMTRTTTMITTMGVEGQATLILQHLDTEMVLRLVEAVLEMLVTQSFDVTSSSTSRREPANIIFTLRKEEKRTKTKEN